MSTIPANLFVAVNPSVLSAGGTALDVIGLLLTTSARVPIGTVQSFPDATSVQDYFGASSDEAAMAGKYFAGFDNSDELPDALLFAQYNEDDVAAFLRGGPAPTLAEVQALNGSLSIVIDGYANAASSINLSAAASLSGAAVIIQNALAASPPVAASITGSISGAVLTITAISNGTVAVGQRVTGTGVAAATIILAQLTGSVGGTGTWSVANTQTIGSEGMTLVGTSPTVTYDSVSGAFVVTSGITGEESTMAFATGTLAASLLLTSATGAVLSQGAEAAAPAAFMNDLIEVTTAWVTFSTVFDPDGGSGNSVKQAFSDWKNLQNDRFCYVCWDTDITPTITVPATDSLGYLLETDEDSGTCLIWVPDAATGRDMAAFVMGAAASIDFEERNGRISFAFKWQAGLVPYVTNATIAVNLGGNPQTGNHGNSYNYGGAIGAANAGFSWFQRGTVTGDFAWLDSYINEIWLNNSFQNALLNLQNSAKSIPYSASGQAMIEAALNDPIQAGLNFGAFAPGPISNSQAVAVNTAAGARISDTLQTQGYYLQVLPATSTVRAARTSPPCKFWYLDRGSVQAITLASVALN